MDHEKTQTSVDRLAPVRSLLDQPWGEDLESDQARLEHRAAALAKQQEVRAPEATIALLLFRLGGETYGLDLTAIEKVLNWRSCVGLPGAPEHLLGLAEVNGEVLSFHDLGRLFCLPVHAAEACGQVIVLGQPEQRIGLHVACLEGIRHVPMREIQPPPVSLPAAGASYLRGVTSDGLIVLDDKKLLSAPELTIGSEH